VTYFLASVVTILPILDRAVGKPSPKAIRTLSVVLAEMALVAARAIERGGRGVEFAKAVGNRVGKLGIVLVTSGAGR
jgi:hypothetical protein